MANLSDELLRALESDCGHTLEPVLAEKKQDRFEALRALLYMDPSIKPAHRQRALYLLGRWGNPAVVADIRRVLPQLEELERITAIDALGRLGTPEALAGVVEHINDPSPDVRRFVAIALTRIDTPQAQAKLNEIARNDPVDFVRNRALRSLK